MVVVLVVVDGAGAEGFGAGGLIMFATVVTTALATVATAATKLLAALAIELKRPCCTCVLSA